MILGRKQSSSRESKILFMLHHQQDSPLLLIPTDMDSILRWINLATTSKIHVTLPSCSTYGLHVVEEIADVTWLSTGVQASDYRRGIPFPCMISSSSPYLHLKREGCTLLGRLMSILNLAMFGTCLIVCKLSHDHLSLVGPRYEPTTSQPDRLSGL